MRCPCVLWKQADPAGRWGAYVAGCLLVLAHEKGARFPDGISILVASDVPEGKGVSSSAALEVAVMSAVAAAHNIELRGRELALLCQKVEVGGCCCTLRPWLWRQGCAAVSKAHTQFSSSARPQASLSLALCCVMSCCPQNLCVGAPCGIMDQMTAALGEAGQLTALLCQPAELQAGVQIPPQVRFWGIDSGIRHSVGGSDYRSVRVGAFMGLKIVRQVLQRQHMLLTSQPTSSMAAVLTEVTSANKPPPLTSSPVSTPGSSSGGALVGSIGAAAAAAVGAAGSSRSASPAVALAGAAGGQQQPQPAAAGGGFFHSGPTTQQRPPITSMQQHHQQQQQLSTAAAAPGAPPPQAAAADRASSSSEGAGGGAGGPSGCGRVLPSCAVSHLANTTPSEYHELYEAELPAEMLGADFLHTYGPHLDTATAVDPHAAYAVRQPTAHPILENHR
jgi:galactokinase